MPKYTHVISSNGGESLHFLRDQLRSYMEQIRLELGLMDGIQDWAFSLWRAPVGKDLDELDEDELHPERFMQSAGSAEAMVVEVKFVEDDGQARLYTVGRPGGDYSGAPSVRIPFQDGKYHVDVYPNEVFTADEATEIYYHYFQTDRVPDQYVLREYDLTYPKPDSEPTP